MNNHKSMPDNIVTVDPDIFTDYERPQASLSEFVKIIRVPKYHSSLLQFEIV